MRRIFTAMTGLMALTVAGQASANDGYILEGVADIPRVAETGPIDGCAKVTKGLIMNGGFMVFTCEKLLPYLPISEHKTSFQKYQSILASEGWSRKSAKANSVKYGRTDAYGCHAQLEMTLWTDRSMFQVPKRPAADRDAHRQIVFKAKFHGAACERYYAQAEALASRYG